MVLQLILFYSILYLINCQNQYYQIPPHDISALIGSNITIPCVIASPHGDVQWTKDGLALGYDRQLPAFPSWSIIGDEYRGEYNFLIQSLKLDDEGIFACEVSPYNDAPALKQIAHIRTLVRPQHVQINDQYLSNKITIISMRFDETIHQVNCQVDGARPAAHIRWFNETDYEYPATSRLISHDRLFSTISTITLVPSLSLDKKRFICDVHHETLINYTNPLRTMFEVQITSPPKTPTIHGYTSTSRLVNGTYLTLSCQSYGGQPLGRLFWYRLENDNKVLKLIDNSSNIFHQENLAENNISMIITPSDNNVTFSCHVINEYLYSLGKILQTNITLQVAFGPSSVHIEGNNMSITTLIEEIPRQFVCRTSSSNPRAIVIWKIDEKILPSDTNPLEESGEYSGIIVQATKTIGLDKSLRNYHGKMLSCEAKNPDTGYTVIDSVQLNIIFDAINIEMYGLTKDKIIKTGDKVTAECILTGGNPLGKITWYKGDELLQSDYSIDMNEKYALSRVEFIASASDNNLPLTCKGQVENFSPRIASFILNIFFLPTEIMIIDSNLLTNLSMDDDDDKPIEFECRTSISNPQTQLTIVRQSNDGQKHFDIQYKTSSIYMNGINSIRFTLPRIDLSFHGNLLTCEATLDLDVPLYSKKVSYVLQVNHKPYFSNFTTSAEVKENQSFNITLEANAYPLPIDYVWYHPSGRRLMNDQLNIFVNEGHLALINIQRKDMGIYRCVATNSIGSTEVNFTLNVLYGPVITRTQGYSILEALMPGSSAILACVIDANPIDLKNVKWYKNNEELSFNQWEKRIEGNEVSLIHKSIQRDDAGQYSCEIDNQFGNSRATLPLVIQYAPQIDHNHNKAATDSDRFLTAELHCYISAIPKPTVTWMKNNQVLSTSSRYNIVLNERISSSVFSPNLLFDAILYIANVTKSDYGIYQCKVENTLGIDKIDIILSGLTIPDPPSQIQITNITHSSLLITWQPGFDGGANQTFQIRYRLSTDDRYFYEHIPYGIESFELRNLRLGKEYYISIRSNNTYHISEWTDNKIISTLNYFPSSHDYASEYSSTKISFTVIIIIVIFGLLILIINVILFSFFVIKRRRTHNNSENLSTTGTNETETNTVEIFQPIPSNLFLPTYKKFDDEDIKRPFVSSYPSVNLSQNENLSSYATIKKDRSSPYDNIRVHEYYPTDLTTYRSFNNDINTSTDIHECIRAELV